MADQPRHITDPKALRALAHPLRWKLLEIVGREGTATATHCAEETGESVANCSYHLKTLAKYDYVVQADGGQGREKPWRLRHQGQRISDVGVDRETELAAHAASSAFLDHTLTQLRERHVASHLEPDEWRRVLGVHDSADYVTPEEVQEVTRVVIELLSKFRERRTNPESRPEGARSVGFFFSTTVAPKHG